MESREHFIQGVTNGNRHCPKTEGEKQLATHGSFLSPIKTVMRIASTQKRRNLIALLTGMRNHRPESDLT